jgi:hypothetical protein
VVTPTLPPGLDAKFVALEADLADLIDLLGAANETFWPRYLAQGLEQVRARRLSGATYVLGCFGGAATFSDFELASPRRQHRLNELRNRIFELANAIAAASARPSQPL